MPKKRRPFLATINENIDHLVNMPHHGYQFGKFVDKIVNLCTYGVILSLVGYMIARILKSFFQIFNAFFTGIAD